MRFGAVLLATSLAGAVALACGGGAPPPKAPETAAPPSPEPAPSGAPAPSASEEPAAPKKKHRPYEITNNCADVVTLVLGDEPKTAPRGRLTLAASSTIEGPRGEDGTETLWLVDDKGEPLINVHVTRPIKKVTIGRSCRTMDAR